MSGVQTIAPRGRSARRDLPEPSTEWAYFLDFDGTLVELAATPDGVNADESIRLLVQQLESLSGGALAIISGRTIASLDALLRSHHLSMAGQHGIERRTASGVVQTLLPARTLLDDARLVVERTLRRFPALTLEDKGLSLALHYRAAPQLASYAHRVMRAACERAGRDYSVLRGKRVVELIPANANKGFAIQAFMAEPPFRDRRPVFIGDDRTDEAGFVTVNALGGISVKVGRGRTAAHWTLPDAGAVRNWLRSVAKPDNQRATESTEVSVANA